LFKGIKTKVCFFRCVSFKIQSTSIRCKYEVQCGDSADYVHEDGACSKKQKKNPAKKGKMEDEKQDSRSKVVVINDVVIMEEEKQDKKGEESITG
jgi:hypothetical protein